MTFAALLVGLCVAADVSLDVSAVPLDGPEAAAAVRPLVAIVLDREQPQPERAAAADRLGRIGDEAVDAVSPLADVARAERARWALKALTRFGPLAAREARTFEQFTADPELASVACEGLARTVAVRPQGLAVFRAALRGHDPADALDALALAGPAVVPLTPEVVRLADSDDGRVRRLTVPLLEASGRPEAVAVLAGRAGKDDDAAFAAVAALGRLGRRRELAQLFKTAGAAAMTHAIIDARAAAGDDVSGLMGSDDAAVRLRAARLSLPSADAIRILVALLRDSDRQVAREAMRSLRPHANHPVAAELLKPNADDPPDVRRLKTAAAGR